MIEGIGRLFAGAKPRSPLRGPWPLQIYIYIYIYIPLVYIENIIRPPNDEHPTTHIPSILPSLFQLGLFYTPINQNLAHLTFKYPKVQTLHNKFSLYQPILNLKKHTRPFFLFLFSLLWYTAIGTNPQNSAQYNQTKPNLKLSSILTISGEKKKTIFPSFFLLSK